MKIFLFSYYNEKAGEAFEKSQKQLPLLSGSDVPFKDWEKSIT